MNNFLIETLAILYKYKMTIYENIKVKCGEKCLLNKYNII